MQLDESNANRLVLRSITAETAGRFRCEVSAEAPSFETVSGHADMTVVRKCRYFVLFFIAFFYVPFAFSFFLFFSLLHQCAHYRPLSLTSSFISSRFFCSAIFGRLLWVAICRFPFFSLVALTCVVSLALAFHDYSSLWAHLFIQQRVVVEHTVATRDILSTRYIV